MTSFIRNQRDAQSAWFAKHLPGGVAGHSGSGYRLSPRNKTLNLAPGIRDDASAYFTAHGIAWHQHANHALSSQVSCLNFLMPLATRPKLLASIIGIALGIPSPTTLALESGPDSRPWFVGFEWIGRAGYLKETGDSGIRRRGANATSADAIVWFEREGRIETVLIEWKYTERYGAPIRKNGNQVRLDRYRDLVFAPFGPIRADRGLAISDFFWEPFYQLMRQQMLAFQMQAAHEDSTGRVRVLHIAPSENRALRVVTAPALRCYGDDAFDVFRKLLVRPDDFVSRSTEAVFGTALSEVDGEARSWADYLLDRYSFLNADKSS